MPSPRKRDRGKRGASAAVVFPPPPGWTRPDWDLCAEGEWGFQLLLWQRVRDVRLWGATPRDQRAGLFQPVLGWERIAEFAAGLVPEIEASVRVLGGVVRYPELVAEADASTACMSIAAWAEENHLPETALHYAEAAACLDPLNAKAAALAGTACARRAADDRAQLWFERSHRVARRTKDWEWYVRALLRLGILLYELGQYRPAKRCYYRARSCALWAGFDAFAGKAHHDLLLIECAIGTFESGERHALRALDLYPVHYDRLPQLAHDIAYFFTCHGYYRPSLEVLHAILPMIIKPCERIAILGTLAKANAGLGNHGEHTASVADVLLFASLSDVNAAAALVLCAEGAMMLHDWERASMLAEKGADVAVRCREREPYRRAVAVLAQGRAETASPAHADPSVAARVEALKTVVLSRLARLAEAPATDAGALTRGRAELTKFTMSGR
jgi:tetratricopeptide (TPR) repeat protein